MIVKREHKTNYVLIFLIVLIASYFTLRVCTLVEQNGGDFKVNYLNEALNTIYKLNTPLIINTQTIGISFFVGFMIPSVSIIISFLSVALYNITFYYFLQDYL